MFKILLILGKILVFYLILAKFNIGFLTSIQGGWAVGLSAQKH